MGVLQLPAMVAKEPVIVDSQEDDSQLLESADDIYQRTFADLHPCADTVLDETMDTQPWGSTPETPMEQSATQEPPNLVITLAPGEGICRSCDASHEDARSIESCFTQWVLM